MVSITPVILCGGSGTRLWPVSRQSMPKQFAPLIGGNSLFAQTIIRTVGDCFSAPLILTASDYRFIVSRQMKEAGCPSASILLEPSAKNTAPAIFAASYTAFMQNPEAVLLILPSDHYIPDTDRFISTVTSAYEAARHGHIVTFGITPDRPETCYGYIETASSQAPWYQVTAFHEKPDLATAERMIETGRYLWNAGIFMFRAETMINEAEILAPEMARAARHAVEQSQTDIGFIRLDPDHWEHSPSESIDYAIMERSEHIVCMPYEAGWSDLGDWQSVWSHSPRDNADNVIHGAAIPVDTRNSLLWSDDDTKPVVGIGLEDIIAVAMDDAVLVASKSQAQNVKLAVQHLKDKDWHQAIQHARDDRPWGWFEVLVSMPGYQVKRLHVHPGGKLSLQSHEHRSEHWIVVDGIATVEIDGVTQSLQANQSTYIEQGQKHRLSNQTEAPLTLIEVQTGSYLGEDDITRYEDIYLR